MDDNRDDESTASSEHSASSEYFDALSAMYSDTESDSLSTTSSSGADYHDAPWYIDTGLQDILVAACETGELSELSELLERQKVDLNVPFECGDGEWISPLSLACRWESLECLQFLLAHGADPNGARKESPRGGPLHEAVRCGSVPLVGALIRAGASVAAVNGAGEAALHVASSLGHVNLAGAPLNAGSSVDRVNSASEAALRLACSHGHSEIVASVLKSDAAVDIFGDRGWHCAVATPRRGRSDMVAALPHAGAEVDVTTSDGVTPLLAAAERGHADVVRDLVNAGANVDVTTSGGMTPLLAAAERGHADVVVALLEAGASVDAANKHGETPLYAAAKRGNTDVVVALLEAGASVDVAARGGITPLHTSAQRGHTDVVTALLGAGASLDVSTNYGGTPLYTAAERGHIDVVTALLEAGASVDVPRKYGETPLYTAAEGGHIDVVAALLEAGAEVNAAMNDGATPLYIASHRGHTDVVAALLEHGASVDLAMNDGETPLFTAAQEGHTKVAVALVRAGASVDLASSGHATPLFIAAQNGHSDVVAALSEGGARVDLATDNSATPLFMAAREGHTQVVTSLLGRGASVDLPMNDGATPLFVAAQRGHTDVVAALLEHGASVDLTTDNGTTPLFMAADMGHTVVVVALLECGASVDLARKDGKTPLFFAASNGHDETVAALLGAGADANLADDRGRTPLAVAVENGHTTVRHSLRSAGALLNGVTRNVEPFVVAASRAGALSVLKECLEADDQPNFEANRLALWWSVACGRAQCVRLLLDKVPNLEEPQSQLPTLLCLAAHQGYVEVIGALIEHDADLVRAAEPVSGLTAVDYAEAAGHDEVAEWLRDHGATSTLGGKKDSAFPAISGEQTCEAGCATIQRTLNLASATGVSCQTTAHSSADGAAVSELSLSAADVATSIERLVSRLHELSDGLVFSHILPTGEVGEGAYGTVQRGNYLGRNVTFKLQKNFDTNSLTVGDVSQLLKFEHEVRVLAVLAEPTHRHCVGFLGVSVSPDVGIAIVTEYVGGGDLRRWLNEHDNFGVVDGLEFLTGLASGLAFLHEAGVVHGDIKPENILLEFEEGDSGRLCGKWIDFGGGYPYWRGHTAYTPRYASPEHLRDQPAHASSDVFSFALIMVEVLSGERPPETSSSTPLQSEEGTHSMSSPPTESVRGGRAAQVCEMWRQLPAELSSCEALVELLVGCWDENVYSRPRTPVVFETLVGVLTSFDPECSAELARQLDEAAPPPSYNSALLTAVQYCDVEEVRRLICEGSRADEQNRWGHTPLHVAATIDNAAIVAALLSTNPQLKEDRFGNTPVDIAYEQHVLFNCRADTYAALFRTFGFQPRARTDTALPLHDAVARQDVGAVRLLLQGGADLNARNKSGDTALHVAARMKASQLVAVLIEHGADVNSVENEQQHSALHLAAESGAVEMVRLLLEAGAAIDTADKCGCTPLMISSEFGHTDVVRALLDGGASITQTREDGATALMLACESGHTDVVRALLDCGASVNQTREDGATALMLASQTGHTDVVHVLLGYGAVVNAAKEDGATALMIAAQSGHTDVVIFVLEAGADVNAAKEDGATALMIAAQSGHTDVVIFVLEAGADVNAVKEDGATALMLACECGHTDVVHVLLVYGADTNHMMMDGKTALVIAAQKGQADVVHVLLEAGADVNNVRESGRTALICACEHGHSDVVRILLSGGANVRVTERSALDAARASGHYEIVALLEDHVRTRATVKSDAAGPTARSHMTHSSGSSIEVES